MHQRLKNQKEKDDKVILLAKTKLNTINLMSLAFINSYISHDEFVVVNKVLSECSVMKQTTQTWKNLTVHQTFHLFLK